MLKMRRVIALVSKFRRATIPDGINEMRSDKWRQKKKLEKNIDNNARNTRETNWLMSLRFFWERSSVLRSSSERPKT